MLKNKFKQFRGLMILKVDKQLLMTKTMKKKKNSNNNKSYCKFHNYNN